MADEPTSSAPDADEEGGSRAEQSVQAFRDALEKSVTISRDLLQETVDDAVKRGRMTRRDAEDLVSRLVTRGREGADDIIGQLESLLAQLGEATDRARSEVGARVRPGDRKPEE